MQTETEFDAGNSRETISSYRRIAELHREHGVTLVQQVRTGAICVRKDLQVYDAAVYRQLQRHPVRGVPRIYAFFENDPNAEDNDAAGEPGRGAPGTLTVIEEYIPGRTLQELLEAQGALSQACVTEIVLQLCDILEQLHGMEPPIVHRDIKPSNVIQKEDGGVVLIDFNAARQNEPGDRRDTRLIGTAGYAAPEQYGFASSTPRADIYAVGQLMRTLLTGSEESNAPLPRGISGGLRRIVNRCTQMNPKDRFSSATALRKALKCYVAASGRRWQVPVCAAVFVLSLLCLLRLLCTRQTQHPVQQPVAQREEAQSAENSSPEGPEGIEGIEGIYKGDADDYLEILGSGLANYYCAEYTELACPWDYAEGILSMYLPKLHCTISAETEEDPEKLFFVSDHPGWRDETFRKSENISQRTLRQAQKISDSNAALQEDGTMLCTLGGFRLTLPQQYIDNTSENEFVGTCSSFYSTDVETGDCSFIFLYQEENPAGLGTEETLRDKVRNLLAQFYDGAELTEEEGALITVAGCPGYQWAFGGQLQTSFGSDLHAERSEGYIALIYNEDSGTLLTALFSQFADPAVDESGSYLHMLQEAQKEEGGR